MNRRGSAIAEAAVVLPVIIMAVLACLLVSVFFCQMTVARCEMHDALRDKAGSLSGRTARMDFTPAWEGTPRIDRRGILTTVTGKETHSMKNNPLLRGRYAEDLYAQCHAADGVDYVRFRTLAKRITEER